MRRWICAVLLLAAGIGHAQLPDKPVAGYTPELTAILEKARAQLENYTQLLPNVIGTELGTSQLYRGGALKHEVSFTANLTMVHAPLKDAPNRVTEQLKFLTENKKPVRKTPTNIPMYLVDVFSNQDPSIFPLASPCVRYAIVKSTPDEIVIERSITPVDTAASAACAHADLGEKVTVTLDAHSFRMTGLERPVQPRKDLRPGAQIGFTYQYAQQRIGDGFYLLPAHIQSTLVEPDKGTRKTFDASYSNYRRYGSTATISLPNQP